MKILCVRMTFFVIAAALVAGGFLSCRMDELATVRPPPKRGSDKSPVDMNPYLDSLSLSGDLALEPLFAPNVLSYTVQLSSLPPASATITATAAEGIAITYTTGQTFAPSSLSPAKIVVTNAGGQFTNYIIVFSLDGESLPSARLADIKLSQGTIDPFDPDIHEYSVKVPYGSGEIAVIPIGEDEGSLFNFNPAGTVVPVTDEPKTVTIGVVSPNRSMGSYSVEFAVDEPEESRLLRVDLSAGSLTPVFTPETLSYEINITESGNPFIVDAVRESSADTVTFIELPGGAVLADGTTAVFDPNQHGSLNNKQFKITVYQGLGYTPTDYTFTILTSANPPALLESLVFANGGSAVGALYQGNPENRGSAGFVSNNTTYTLEFADGAIAEMTALGESGAAVECGGSTGNQVTVPYNPLRASNGSPPVRNFVTITAHKAAHITTTYTVYFKKIPLPPAALERLDVYGGTLVHIGGNTPVSEDEVQDAEMFDGNNHKQYAINALANTQAVIVEGTPKEPASMSVTYSPKNFVNNMQQSVPQTILVQVVDGLDYADSTYELTVNVLEAQLPRFESLTLRAASDIPVMLNSSVLVYAHTIPFANRPADGKPAFAWTAASCVSAVSYSFNSGSTWLPDNEKNGFDATDDFTVQYSETKHLLVKLRAADGTEAVYTLIVTQEGNPNANLTDIKVYKAQTGDDTIPIYRRVDQSTGFAPAVYAYDVKTQNGSSAAYIVPAGPDGADITYSIDRGAPLPYTSGRINVTGLTINDVKTVDINVQVQGGGAPNTYTLYIKQQANDEALLLDMTTPAAGTLMPSSFAAGTFYYTYEFPYDFNGSVQFTPRSISSEASLEKSDTPAGVQPNFTSASVGAPVSVSSTPGGLPKTVSFRVKAQNNINSNIYNFYITKAQNNEAKILTLSSNIQLKTDSGPAPFNADIKAYSSTVTNGDDIKITPNSISPNASMSYSVITDNVITTQQLPLAPNVDVQFGGISVNQTKIIIFTVVSQDASTVNSYTFSITRPGSEDAKIIVLDTGGGTLSPANFTQNTYNYTLTVPRTETTAEIQPKQISAGASVSAQIDGGAGPFVTAAADGSIISGSIPVNIGNSSSSIPKLLTFTVTPQTGAAVGVYNFYVTHQTASTDTALDVTFTVEQSEDGSSFSNYTPSNTFTTENNTLEPAYKFSHIKITPVFTAGSSGPFLFYKNDSGVFEQAASSTGYFARNLAVFEPKTIVFQVRSQSGAPGKMYTFTIIRQLNTNADLSIDGMSISGSAQFLKNNWQVTLLDTALPLSDNMSITFKIPAGAVLYHINGSSMNVVSPTISGIMLGDTITTTLSFMLQPQNISTPSRLYTLTLKRAYAQTFESGSTITWTAPLAGRYSMYCRGGYGGESSTNVRGGYGGTTEATLNLTKGSELKIRVGGVGRDGAQGGQGGYNGGGNGSSGTNGTGGGGGGASDIRRGGDELQHRIMTAGGGGGGSCGSEHGFYGGSGQYGNGEYAPRYPAEVNTAAQGTLSATWHGSTPIGNALLNGQSAAANTSSGGGGGGYMGGFANIGSSTSYPGGGGSSYIHESFEDITPSEAYSVFKPGVVHISYIIDP